jgi:copper homeostasis protein (lipoprotein)
MARMDPRPDPPASPRRLRRSVRRALAAMALAALVVLAGGCRPGAPGSGTPGTEEAQAPSADARELFPPDQDSERTWAGLLPCSDCQGVDTRLVLRMHGGKRDYLLTETYLGSDGAKRFNRAGPWRETNVSFDGETATVFQLDPAQAGQQYAVQPDGALELLDGNGRLPADAVVYRLQRL